MIKVHVVILGALTRPSGKDDFEHEVSDGANLEGLLLALGYQQTHLRFIVASVNGIRRSLGYQVCDRDEVVLVLPTSGG